MEVVHKRCCGLDVHKRVVVACITIREKGKLRKEIQSFGTMTSDLMVLRDWLKAYGTTHVAMESTGVYWKPIYNLLEDDFEIILVNAAHIKNVPGRKTDVKDCEWIADLLSHGLLKSSFIPPRPIRDLRDLTRYRKSLIDERTRQVNRLQKLLESANIKLSSVATDVMGASGRAMFHGTVDPNVLAELAKGRLRKKLPLLRQALEGRFRPHHRFLLEQILSHLDFLDESIERISEEVARRTDPFAEEIKLLKTIPGVEQRVAETIVAEVGVDMQRFPSHRHISAWAGVCPGNNESAGKRKSGKVRKGNKWLKRTLVESAWAVSRAKETYLFSQYHRLVRRRGKKKAALAVGHAILVIAYCLLRYKTTYQELGSDYFDKINLVYTTKHFVKRLESLGYNVYLEPISITA